jgi:hypothetical protein
MCGFETADAQSNISESNEAWNSLHITLIFSPLPTGFGFFNEISEFNLIKSTGQIFMKFRIWA